MRTTIELPDEMRARLLEIAARRGEKGFSGLVQEAVGRYLDEEKGRRESVTRALSARGTMDPDEAENVRSRIAELRRRWR